MCVISKVLLAKISVLVQRVDRVLRYLQTSAAIRRYRAASLHKTQHECILIFDCLPPYCSLRVCPSRERISRSVLSWPTSPSAMDRCVLSPEEIYGVSVVYLEGVPVAKDCFLEGGGGGGGAMQHYQFPRGVSLFL